jgi:hypothetical protein
MSPRQEPARPIKKIKLKVTFEGDGPTVAVAASALKWSKVSGTTLVRRSQTSDLSEAITEISRLGEALKAPKDFK